MKLQEFAETIKMDIYRIGFNPKTEQTDFVVKINNESFEFHCGILAFLTKEDKLRLSHSFKHIPTFNANNIFEAICRGGKIPQTENGFKVCELISQKQKPTNYDILYCLKIDSEIMKMSFDDYCLNFEYSNDSIKDFNLYQCCLENGKRLKMALGREKFEEMMKTED
jgi:hypothetical protein